MKTFMTDRIFRVTGAHEFNRTALEIFHFQAAGCPLYRQYISLLGIQSKRVNEIGAIPFMPVSFFRDHTVMTGSGEPERTFISSGTSGMRQSRHAVKDLALYDDCLGKTFRIFYGDPSQYAIMGLLPSYLEREGSSLIYMVNRLIQLSGNDAGGFFPGDHTALLKAIDRARSARLQVLIIGVTFALLDLADKNPCNLSDVIIMETGGMKGRRHEMIREEVHDVLKKAFGIRKVHSEYGMTELLSQAYSKGDGLFMTPPWMKILMRDSHDPLSHTDKAGVSGGINVIDLANLWSCSFIATDDLGRMHSDNKFEVLGRYDNSDIRGCSLLSADSLM
jgi:hypothetical protein